MPNEILQRERLGGIALSRNQTYPGNAVSWRFDQPDAATQVAILMPDATTDHFKVIAYNASDATQQATMTTWNVTGGQWKMTGDDGDRELTLDRSASTQVSFAPHKTTTLEFTLVKAGEPNHVRPDLGIGVDDVAVSGKTVSVTVHSLGSVAASGGTVTLVGADGAALGTAAVPALAAPTDLLPKTTVVKLAMPAGVAANTVTVRVALPDNAPEVTMLNNAVPLSAAVGK
jgi:hypothetical protein